ncbi:uncharacterized protein TRAVEDRAFT_42430 [Trametes versicolor FP-101664 SS1]|uniref:uncharacterized protein n=1 Tax=Trametes versicolor (strain FP-101664) TaxID=717944 RepID=UPI0004623FAB|nr:uncharacterized protein TRAVEDRAFT_42430 [Trametes versicolor FP-101664 SS1]EIW65034.1 hypothetical protein TRAVEDRAFT_42430 [Trametes versicolor FP-101664 SS1]
MESPRWETLPGSSSKPGADSPTKTTPGWARFRRALAAEPSEKFVVSDSEEERQRRVKARRVVLANVNMNELPVIEISDSEDEDESSTSVVAQKGDSQPSAGNPDGSAQQTPQATRIRLLTLHARRVVVSSDSEVENGDVKQGRPPATTQAAPRRRLPLDDDIIDLTETPPGSDHEQEEPRDPEPAEEFSEAKE